MNVTVRECCIFMQLASKCVGAECFLWSFSPVKWQTITSRQFVAVRRWLLRFMKCLRHWVNMHQNQCVMSFIVLWVSLVLQVFCLN